MTRQTRTLPIKRAAHVYLVQDGKMLLVTERMDDGAIFYGLPGGKALAGESLADAAVRQVRVETGLTVMDLRFVSLLEGEMLTGTNNECYANFARFTADFEGTINPTDPEVLGCEWVPFDDVLNLVRFGPPPEVEERNPLIWVPTRDFLSGTPHTYYPI